MVESKRPLSLQQVNEFQSRVVHLSTMQQYIIFVGLAVSAAFDGSMSPAVFDTSAPGECFSRSVPKSRLTSDQLALQDAGRVLNTSQNVRIIRPVFAPMTYSKAYASIESSLFFLRPNVQRPFYNVSTLNATRLPLALPFIIR